MTLEEKLKILDEWKQRVKQNITGKTSLALLDEILSAMPEESECDHLTVACGVCQNCGHDLVKHYYEWEKIGNQIAKRKFIDYHVEVNGVAPEDVERYEYVIWLDKDGE